MVLIYKVKYITLYIMKDAGNRKIIRLGRVYVVNLGSELMSLGLNKGDTIRVYVDGNRIILTNDTNSIHKPVGISDDVWKDFVSLVINKHGTDILNNISSFVEEALKMWIKEEKRKYVLKIKF